LRLARTTLREIARAGYEGAAGTDHAVALFLTDAVVQLDLGWWLLARQCGR